MLGGRPWMRSSTSTSSSGTGRSRCWMMSTLRPSRRKPRGHLLRIGDVAAEQQQLHRRRQGQDHAFVMVAPIRIGQPLVFVNDQQLEGMTRSLAEGCPTAGGDRNTPGLRSRLPLEAALHRLEGCHDDRRVRRESNVTSHDAHLPAPGAPLGELVVCQGPGWHSEKGPSAEIRSAPATVQKRRFSRPRSEHQ